MRIPGNIGGAVSSSPLDVPVPPHTILVVEDDTLFRKALVTFLTTLGFHLVIAESAEEALTRLDKEVVHLALIDYHLPGMNGIELARVLHSHDAHPPMILLSGYLSERVQREAFDARITCVLRKPADMRILESTILQVFNRQLTYGSVH
jgi:CheY-like chemotaxis protein